MQTIINGKKYDTETAKVISAYISSDLSESGHIVEILYQKKTGEFFIFGEGGEMTPYSKVCRDGTLCGSSRIIPISEKKAKAFVEEYGDAEEYEEAFGEVEE